MYFVLQDYLNNKVLSQSLNIITRIQVKFLKLENRISKPPPFVPLNISTEAQSFRAFYLFFVFFVMRNLSTGGYVNQFPCSNYSRTAKSLNTFLFSLKCVINYIYFISFYSFQIDIQRIMSKGFQGTTSIKS